MGIGNVGRFAFPGVFALIALSACAHGPPRPEEPATSSGPAQNVFVEHGLASVYANSLAGKLTASGEPYDPERLTAAHRTLSLGTRAEVVSETNGRSVTVRINDRGPFVRGRIIDLSPAAAARIGLVGLMRVEIRIARESGPEAVAALPSPPATAHGH